ncbi:thioredoxin-like protein [Blyttiomyces helicus]|uniref:Thioredoxin-like protein n=1 Tax=Blyttiomyces helicus TaxID=388810 RepID=A0A4P9W2E8_9FUNG|nr:thioredoxin-like protein [Blyttiomyces helicus]|eukprot:RKO84958.1 thioredoxin-like protein [Blyttiomyces helicus]
MPLRLGNIAPNFDANTTQGPIKFHDWKANSWAILFSHPDDFTPVCTTELGGVARLAKEWEARGVKVIGLSCNTLDQHEKWIADINDTQNTDVKFPIIADASRAIATEYDMLDIQDETNKAPSGLPLTVRSVFVVDPKNVIRLILTYPASTGRNFDEVLRAVDSLQLTDKRRVATPVGWKTGDDVIILGSVKNEEAEKIFPGFKTIRPYLRTVNLAEVDAKLAAP